MIPIYYSRYFWSLILRFLGFPTANPCEQRIQSSKQQQLAIDIFKLRNSARINFGPGPSWGKPKINPVGCLLGGRCAWATHRIRLIIYRNWSHRAIRVSSPCTWFIGKFNLLVRYEPMHKHRAARIGESGTETIAMCRYWKSCSNERCVIWTVSVDWHRCEAEKSQCRRSTITNWIALHVTDSIQFIISMFELHQLDTPCCIFWRFQQAAESLISGQLKWHAIGNEEIRINSKLWIVNVQSVAGRSYWHCVMAIAISSLCRPEID